MAASTFYSALDGSTVSIGLALPASFTPPATCFGPAFSGNNTLRSSSGAYYLTVGYDSDCAPPGADRTESKQTAAGSTTTTLPFYSGVCPSGYATAEGTHDLLPGIASTIAICCPSGVSTTISVPAGLSPSSILSYGAAGKCSRLAQGQISVVSGSNTQVLATDSGPVYIVEQPIVALVESDLPPLAGITYTSVSAVSSGKATRTIETIIPSTTAVFSVPSSCFDPTFTIGVQGYDAANLRAADFAPQRGGTACYPEGYWAQDNTLPVGSTSGLTSVYYEPFYYPGSCPSSFEMATDDSWTQTAAGSQTVYEGGWCCPSGWVIEVDGRDYYCITKPSSSVTVVDTYQTYTLDQDDVSAMTYWPIGVATTTQVLHAEASPGSTGSMPTNTGTGPQYASGSGSNLSDGAAAGIGVGVGLGVLVLGLAAFVLSRRWKQHSPRHELGVEHARGDSVATTAELTGDGRPMSPSKLYEAPHDTGIHEAPGKVVSTELEDTTFRAELPGDSPCAEVPGSAVKIG